MTKLDDMLAKWPMSERPQLEADEAAERVVAEIEGGQLPASLDETLLAAPFPKTDDEGQISAPAPVSQKAGHAGSAAGVENKMSKDRTRDRTSFQELAKMATTPPPPTSTKAPTSSGSGPAAVVRGKEADSSDSGIVDLKMIASADPSGAQRAQSTPLAASGLFDDDSAPAKPAVTAEAAAKATAAPSAPTSSPAKSAATAPAAKAAEAVAQPAASAKKAVGGDEKKGGGGAILFLVAGVVAAGAIAAGVVLYVKHSPKVAVATHTAAAPDTAAAAQAARPAAPTATPSSSVAELAADELPTTDVNGKPALRAGHVQHHAAAATESAAAPPPPGGTVDPKLVANIPTGPAGASSGDLAAAMKMAAGGGTGLGNGAQQSDQGPKYAPGTVPERPSQGQVAGAVGAVMGPARDCLPGGVPVSHATITFQSDGTVKSVSVTGYAAGKPAEACIRTALKKAKVDPFAEATYPVPVSIRANQ